MVKTFLGFDSLHQLWILARKRLQTKVKIGESLHSLNLGFCHLSEIFIHSKEKKITP
jgi:hypothetical protein